MVIGLERFKTHFAGLEDSYILIGGSASPGAIVLVENFRRLRQKNSTNCQIKMDIQALCAILLKIFAVCVRKIQ